jgi:hypothetical protein
MPERLQSGQYVIGHKEDTRRRDPPKTVGVIKGETANEIKNGGFHRILGLSKSKWYVYTEQEELRQYHDRSGTGVMMVTSLEKECSSKGDAVSYAESRYNL